MNAIQTAVLTAACSAYPDPTPLPTQFGGSGLGGDTLADFMVREIKDVTLGASNLGDAKKAAADAMTQAADDLMKVADALRR